MYSHCLRVNHTNGIFATVNNGSKLFSQYNNSIHVIHCRIGTRINFEQRWVGIVHHRRREHGMVKTKGKGYALMWVLAYMTNK